MRPHFRANFFTRAYLFAAKKLQTSEGRYDSSGCFSQLSKLLAMPWSEPAIPALGTIKRVAC